MTNKILNNFIFGLITVITFNSCTQNDDGAINNTTPNEQKSIVGLWFLDYYIENNILIEEVECNRQLAYKFLSNNTYTLTSFAGDDLDNCQPAVIINGTWEFVDDTTFSLLVNGAVNAEEIEITFQDNFTKYTILRSANLTEVYSRQ